MNNFLRNSTLKFATKWVESLKEKMRQALAMRMLKLVKQQSVSEPSLETALDVSHGNVILRDDVESLNDSGSSTTNGVNRIRPVTKFFDEKTCDDVRNEEECLSRMEMVSTDNRITLMEVGSKGKKMKKGRKMLPAIVKKMDDVTESIHVYLTTHFELRYNVLTEQTEYRPIGGRLVDFQPMDQRQVNTLCIEIRRDGVNCWDRDLMRYLNSAFVTEYHPFRLYLDELPEWDGTERLRDLAERVSASEYWVKAFHRWMLGMTAQWMGMEQIHSNSVAPLLVSQQQGWQKSTFCKSLIPKPLLGYYTDQLNLASSATEVQLSLMGLINLDEFDRISSNKMAQLKNLMQLSSLNIRKAYKKNFQRLPRIASFIGTSNRRDLLTDPTGSRRFICVDVDGPINCEGIDLEQIYAQLKTELLAGERFWFTHEEEVVIQQHNADFYRLMPEEEIFRVHFRSPKGNESYELLSLAEILETMRQFHKGLMHNLNLAKFGCALVGAGVERVHTIEGTRYKVVRID